MATKVKPKARAKGKTSEKIDVYKLHKADYVAPKDPVILNLKSGKYLTTDGQGKPGSPEFSAHMGALYGAAYTIKFARKFSGGPDFKVAMPEGIYWSSDPAVCIAEQSIEQWAWKLMIRVPDLIGAADLKHAITELEKKKKIDGNVDLKLERIAEGKCVQALHVGPYDKEPETIARMKAFAEAQGFQLARQHHEIYFSDPCRVAPEKLKTVLRIPVSKPAVTRPEAQS